MATSTFEYSFVVGGDRDTEVNQAEGRRIANSLAETARQNPDKKLTKVDLSGRQWSLEGAQEVAAQLGPLVKHVRKVKLDDMVAGVNQNEALKVLELFSDLFAWEGLLSVSLSDNAIGALGVPKCKSILTNTLEELYLCNAGMCEDNMRLLAETLAGSKCLRAIHVTRNMISIKGAEHFATLVKGCHMLKDINYSGNRPQLRGTRAICEALGESTMQLLKLTLSDGTLFSEYEANGVQGLCKVLARSPQLTHLDLSDLDMTDDGMKPVAYAILDGNAPLEYLNVDHNDLSKKSCGALSRVLACNQESLRIFSANENEDMRSGVATLVRGYTSNRSVLQTLSLKKTGLNGDGVIALATARTDGHLPSVTSLTVCNTNLSEDNITALVNAFRGALQLEEGDSDEEGDDDAQASTESHDDSAEDNEDAIDGRGAGRPEDIAILSQRFEERRQEAYSEEVTKKDMEAMSQQLNEMHH